MLENHVLFLLIWITSLFAYDLEVQLNMDPKFANKINDVINDNENTQIQFDVNVPEDLFKRLGIPNRLFRSAVSKVLRTNTDASNIFSQITERGAERIKNTGEIIKSNLKPEDVSQLFEKAIAKYRTRIQQYIEQILKSKIETELDKQTITFDIVETSNDYIYNASQKLLRDVNDLIANPDDPKITVTLMDTFNTMNLNYLIEDYALLCENLALCRIYPGLSDYLAGLIREIISMRDEKLHTYLKAAKKVVKSEEDIFENILGEDTNKKVKDILKNFFALDLLKIKEKMSRLHKVITLRRKFTKTPDEDVNRKLQALRVLLDIIDKAFENQVPGDISARFSTILKATREWLENARDDIETIIYTHLNFFISQINVNWSNSTKNEVSELVQVMFLDEQLPDEFSYLLHTGSNYTRPRAISKDKTMKTTSKDENNSEDDVEPE